MISDVPPKDTLAPSIPLKKIGITCTITRPHAPIKIMYFNIFDKYSTVGRHGLMPGIKPPLFFILFATSNGLKVMDV